MDTEIADRRFRWEGALTSRTRRSLTTEYKVEAAHPVIDSGSTIAEVARGLGMNEALFSRRVPDDASVLPQSPAINP